MNEIPTPITDAAEKSPFQHAVGCHPPNYMSVESGIVRDLEQRLTEMTKSEQEIGRSYIRIREIVKAWNTDLGGEDRFQVTEETVQYYVDQTEELGQRLIIAREALRMASSEFQYFIDLGAPLSVHASCDNGIIAIAEALELTKPKS